MGLFYAYLRDPYVNEHCRYLITFISRETADEWWRMMSTPSSPYAGHIRRISPQVYFQNDIYSNNVVSFWDAGMPHANQFYEKMFFSPLSNAKGCIPTPIRSIAITDHISGRWYFIRSKANCSSHWYVRTDGACLVCGDASCDAIHVSSEYRTKLCVRVRAGDDFQVPEDFVMIGKDEISIIAPVDHVLHINDAGDLRVKSTTEYQGGSNLLFNDLKTRFITRVKKQVNGEVWECVVPVERGLGEVWELVD